MKPKKKAHGQVRRGQIITTYGPGALVDLPRDSAILAGLRTWLRPTLEEIVEPRLSRKLQVMTGVSAPKLYAPPPEENEDRTQTLGIRAYRFPEWFVVQERGGKGADGGQPERRARSRRLVHRRQLADGRFDGLAVIATRFVRACPAGHIDDVDWVSFVHSQGIRCAEQMWLDERGTSGDLRDLWVRCECGASRQLSDAADTSLQALGTCFGHMPWLGIQDPKGCKRPLRLLIRTAANAYFPQVFSVLSLPDRTSEIDTVVHKNWELLQYIEESSDLKSHKKNPRIADALAPFRDQEVLDAIQRQREGSEVEASVKAVELDAILQAPEGFGDDVPLDPDFHARRLPRHVWKKDGTAEGIAHVIQLHRLREVMALTGFTRFEPQMVDIHGEYESDVERAPLDVEPEWFPAVENRGEGLFIEFDPAAIRNWERRKGVQKRLRALTEGHEHWKKDRKSKRLFPDGPYVFLHTLSHLLIQSLAMRCGYPATSIRERIYAEEGGFGILLYTGSPDAEGTLGGLVQEARHLERHLQTALRMGSLCSNDPICSNHEPATSLESRWLHGAACHGCVLLAETSCEMRNEYLDRALVVPVLGVEDAAFFGARP